MPNILRPSARFALLLVHALVGLVLAPLARRRGQALHWPLIHWWHRRVLRILGVQLRVHGRPALGPVLMVANHVSWLDIPTIGSQAPVVFLSKAEVGQWWLVGRLARRAGTLFIERGDRRHGSAGAIRRIAASLQAGRSVILFPEATTTDGEDVRRFHARLFQAAIDAGAAVQPVALRYPGDEGVDPRIPFIDDDTLADSLRRMLPARRLRAEIHFLEPIETAGSDSRDALAAAAHQRVRAAVVRPAETRDAH